MNRYPDRGLHGRAVEQLGSQIASGRLAVGETIDTDQLASSLDVSRTVIREALRVIAGKGLVDARPRRGTYVRDRGSWNLLDPDVLRWRFESTRDSTMFDKLHELRVMVEPAAASLAAMRRTPEDAERLFAAVNAMAAAGDASEVIAEHDLDFHLGLIAATHNELIEQLSMVIGVGLAARDRFVHTHAIPIQRSLEIHGEVARAVSEGDPDAARALMLDLLASASTDVEEAVAHADGSSTHPSQGDRRAH